MLILTGVIFDANSSIVWRVYLRAVINSSEAIYSDDPILEIISIELSHRLLDFIRLVQNANTDYRTNLNASHVFRLLKFFLGDIEDILDRFLNVALHAIFVHRFRIINGGDVYSRLFQRK